MKNLGIYIHVPFCIKKCNYCDFYSTKWNDEIENKFIESIKNELYSYKSVLKSNYAASTIFFGGGTPTILNPDNLKRIMKTLGEIVKIDSNSEISIEANPNTLTMDNLKVYKSMGINRLSIGIQSLNDEILKNIGRIHNSKEALESIERAQAVGFENINADVMFNIPGQSVKDIEETLANIIEKGVKHISFYSLKLEKGTPMFTMEKNKKIIMPDEDVEREMYYTGRNIMERYNLLQYEISNFSLKGYECKHNLKYWNQEQYIGLGPSAHSFLNNIRYSNPSDINYYIESFKSNVFERIIQEDLCLDDLMFEYVMLQLRLTKGINIDEFNRKFSANFLEMYKLQIDYLLKNNLIEYVNHYIYLTKKGMDISNYVIEEFMIS